MGNTPEGQAPEMNNRNPGIRTQSIIRDGQGRVVLQPSSTDTTRDSLHDTRDPLQDRFSKVWNEERHGKLRGMYNELNQQATLAAYNDALAPIAELNKKSADGLMKVIEDLKAEALNIEAQLTDPGQKAQIRKHFDAQVDQMEPLLEKLLLNHNEQQKILRMHQGMIDKASTQYSGGQNPPPGQSYLPNVHFSEGMSTPIPPLDNSAAPVNQYMQMASAVSNHRSAGRAAANGLPPRP